MRIWGRLLVALLLASTPAAAQYAYIGGQNKVRYDKFDWKTYDTPHFKMERDVEEIVCPIVCPFVLGRRARSGG